MYVPYSCVLASFVYMYTRSVLHMLSCDAFVCIRCVVAASFYDVCMICGFVCVSYVLIVFGIIVLSLSVVLVFVVSLIVLLVIIIMLSAILFV